MHPPLRTCVWPLNWHDCPPAPRSCSFFNCDGVDANGCESSTACPSKPLPKVCIWSHTADAKSNSDVIAKLGRAATGKGQAAPECQVFSGPDLSTADVTAAACGVILVRRVHLRLLHGSPACAAAAVVHLPRRAHALIVLHSLYLCAVMLPPAVHPKL